MNDEPRPADEAPPKQPHRPDAPLEGKDLDRVSGGVNRETPPGWRPGPGHHSGRLPGDHGGF